MIPKSLFGQRNIYSSTSRHQSLSEDDFHFSHGGGGLVNGNPKVVCFQSQFSGNEIYTAVRVDTTHRQRIIFISLMGVGEPAERELESCVLPKSLFGYQNIYSSTSRHQSLSEDDFHFSHGGGGRGGAAKQEPQSSMIPKSLLEYRNLYSSTSRYYSSSEDYFHFSHERWGAC